MKDPLELPRRGLRYFHCINIFTGHVGDRKMMTAEIAIRINSYHHMVQSGYKWLWDDQENFNNLLNFDSAIVLND